MFHVIQIPLVPAAQVAPQVQFPLGLSLNYRHELPMYVLVIFLLYACLIIII
jgi:hypothetical protein